MGDNVSPPIAPAGEASSRAPSMPYEAFLNERQKLVEARQRVQQRTDSLIAGGAAGALVLSITFLEKIAPLPTAIYRSLLVYSWMALLMALLLHFLATFLSQKAFDDAIDSFDQAFIGASQSSPRLWALKWTKGLGVGSAIAFVIGISLLAGFAYKNVIGGV